MIVHYQDENGNELASGIVLSGYVGDDHITGAKDLANYTLKARSTNATEFFSVQTQDVTYIYTKNNNNPSINNPTNSSTKP